MNDKPYSSKGAAILLNGTQMTSEEVVITLNKVYALKAALIKVTSATGREGVNLTLLAKLAEERG